MERGRDGGREGEREEGGGTLSSDKSESHAPLVCLQFSTGLSPFS